MSSKNIQFNKEMQILTEIRKHKFVLFSAFTDTVRKTDKIQAWKDIANIAQSIALIPPTKDWAYLRDTLWQNWKRTTMLKVDNSKKTGTGGMGKLTALDDIIVDIIGKESPIIQGLGIVGSLDTSGSQNPTEHLPNDTNQGPSTSMQSTIVDRQNKRKRTTSSRDTDILDKKNRKMELHIEHLELSNYKLKLENLELERRLNIRPSKFTRELTTEKREYRRRKFTRLRISQSN